MGYGDFGCFNRGLSRTPTLDHLVGEGVCLTQHYSASPVCAPARASLMTGRYPHRTGVIDTLETRGLDRLALREITIAELLKRAGYATGLVGKWHNGAYDARYHPNRRGFDEFAGFSGGWQPYYQWNLDRNGSISRGDGRYLTDVFTAEATEFINRHRHRNDPFFLYLAYNAPHFPFEAIEADAAPYKETGKFTLAVSQIYAMIECMDRGVARVLDELERAGIADNTLVMFSSDNGPQFGGKGDLCTDRFNCGFAGAKTLVYEGGIRLPMVLRWPAGLDGRRQVDEMIHFTDWLPTMLALAGVESPARSQARRNRRDALNPRRARQGAGSTLLAMEPLHPRRRMQRRNARRPMETSPPRNPRADAGLQRRPGDGHPSEVQPRKISRHSPRPRPTPHQTRPTPRPTLRHRNRPLRTKRSSRK